MKLKSSARCWSVFAALTFASSPGFPQAQALVQAFNVETPIRTDRILVRSRPGIDPHLLTNFHAVQKSHVLRTWPQVGGIQLLLVPSDESVHSFLQKYRGSDLIEYAEPDWVVRLAAGSNDPRYLDGSLWALHNTGQNAGSADADIDAPEAWNAMTAASNVVVAVVDTGVRYTHEDLAANMWVNAEDGSHGFNALTASNDPTDESGHGTRLAGVIGAVGNNGLGIVGVSWRVQIIACKFADNQGGSTSDAISCIEFAITNEADVINASWGLYDYSLSLSNAIYAAREAGVVVVAAAGNNALDTDLTPYYPSSLDLDNIVSVAATTRRDDLYQMSNIGPTNVDLAAPGFEILSTDFTADSAYAVDEGTSMSAAYVSGACALLCARFPNESPQQIVQRLIAGADPLPGLAGLCVSGGRLNLRKSLGLPENGSPSLTAQRPANTGAVEILLSGEPDRPYVIEATTNIVNWTTVFTNTTDVDGKLLFTDNSWTNYAQRFYRARLAP